MVRRVKNSVEFIYCYCNCGFTRPKYDRWGNKRQFIKGHIKGKYASRYEKGWYIRNGYKSVLMPEHHFAGVDGYVLEHRLVWEEHHKACLLPWADVHHKNVHDLSKKENRLDNTPENLEAMTKSQHAFLHGKQNCYVYGNKWGQKDMSNRVCLKCNSRTTFYEKGKRNGYRWYRYKDGFICRNCYYLPRKRLARLMRS